MFKLIDSSDDFSRFIESIYTDRVEYYFPSGLVLLSPTNKPILIGDYETGTTIARWGDPCASFDSNWLVENNITSWELYEYQLQTKE